MASKPPEHQKHVEGNATVFDVSSAAAPKSTFLMVIGAIAVLFGLIAPGGFKVFFLPPGALRLAFGWMWDPHPRAHRAPITFRLTPEAIESNGRTLSRDDIRRLVLRNGVTEEELLEAYTTDASQAAGMAHRASAARVANGLAVEAGGKLTLLAGEMDETTAYGLLHEAPKILGVNTK